MESSTVAAPQAPPEPEPSHDGAAEATRSTEELFQWSGYVHVGRGAEGCEHGADGTCTDPEHFHAWVCLPNTFQIRDITDKARAAKARKARSLRDPNSDSYVVLEDELESLRRDAYDELVRALARAEVEKRLVDMVHELNEDERFEHHAQDLEELNRLRALPEEQRDAEEVERLEADALAYAEALQERIDAAVEREVERLKALDQDAVIDMERRSRIDITGTEAYLHTYYTWTMYVGARVPTMDGFPSRRKFAEPEDLKNAPPEVVHALREKIRELEQRTTQRGDAAGNS